MKRFLLSLLVALSFAAHGAAPAEAGWFSGKDEPAGAHSKNARGSTRNQHETANGRRAREQAAAAERQARAAKAGQRRAQARAQQKAAQRKGKGK